MKKALKIVGMVFVALVILGMLFGGGDKKKDEEQTASAESVVESESVAEPEPETEPEPESVEEAKPEKDYSKYFYNESEDIIIYRTALTTVSNNYVNVSYPWGNDDYTFADLNPEDDGLVIGMTKATAKGVVEKLPVVICFWTDGTNIRTHYFSVGDKVYVDDGTLDDLFETLKAISALQ